MNAVGLPEFAVVLIIAVVFAWPTWRVFSKAGFPGWLSLLVWVPFVNVGLLFYVAFAEWPIERELKVLRSRNQPD